MVIRILLFIIVLIIIYIVVKDDIRTKYKIKKIFQLKELTYIRNIEDFIDESFTEERVDQYVVKETQIIKSEYTKEEIPFDLILPVSIKDFEVDRVLVLLHGIRDKKEDWVEKGKLLENYIQLLESDKIGRIAFILPNSGYSGESWYTNFYQLDEFRYEDFFSKELLPSIKDRF